MPAEPFLHTSTKTENESFKNNIGISADSLHCHNGTRPPVGPASPAPAPSRVRQLVDSRNNIFKRICGFGNSRRLNAARNGNSARTADNNRRLPTADDHSRSAARNNSATGNCGSAARCCFGFGSNDKPRADDPKSRARGNPPRRYARALLPIKFSHNEVGCARCFRALFCFFRFRS